MVTKFGRINAAIASSVVAFFTAFSPLSYSAISTERNTLQPQADFYTTHTNAISLDNRLLVSPVQTSYVSFDVSDLNHAPLNSAKLRLYLANDSHNAQTEEVISVTVLKATDAAEMSEFGSAPAVGSAYTPALGMETASIKIDGKSDSQYWEWDVSAHLKGLNGVANDVVGFAISGSDSGATFRFTDSNPANDSGKAGQGFTPELVVEFLSAQPDVDLYTTSSTVTSSDDRLLVSPVQSAYMTFDVSDLNGIPVDEAVLRLYLPHDNNNEQSSRSVAVSIMTFSEASALHNANISVLPGQTYTPILGNEKVTVNVDGSTESRYWEWNVTSLLQGEHGTENGVIGLAVSRTGTGGTFRFSDSDPENDFGNAAAGLMPQLYLQTRPTKLNQYYPRLRGFTASEYIDGADIEDAAELEANALRLMLNPTLRDQWNPENAWESMVNNLPEQLNAAVEEDIYMIVSLFMPPIPGYRQMILDPNMGSEAFTHEFWTNERYLELMIDHALETVELLRPYKGRVWLELKNEPLDWSVFPKIPLNWASWSQQIIDAVRQVSDIPIVVQVGPGGYSDGYSDFPLLKGGNIVYSVHQYKPHKYTHQGLNELLGTDLQKPYEEINLPWPLPLATPYKGFSVLNSDWIDFELQSAIDFVNKYGVRMYVGEVGVIRWAPNAADYLQDNLDIFEREGWDWTYHAYRSSSFWSFEHNTEYTSWADAELATEPTELQKKLEEYLQLNKQ